MKLLNNTALTGALALCLGALPAFSDEIKIGAFSTLEGAFAVLGEESMRGVDMALAEVGDTYCEHTITVLRGASDASSDSAVAAARKLVAQDTRYPINVRSGDETDLRRPQQHASKVPRMEDACRGLPRKDDGGIAMTPLP